MLRRASDSVAHLYLNCRSGANWHYPSIARWVPAADSPQCSSLAQTASDSKNLYHTCLPQRAHVSCDFVGSKCIWTSSVLGYSCYHRASALPSNGNQNMKTYTRSSAPLRTDAAGLPAAGRTGPISRVSRRVMHNSNRYTKLLETAVND